MATHSSILAWRIPGTEEPGGLPSMGLYRVRHDWSDLAATAAAGACPVYRRPSISACWEKPSSVTFLAVSFRIILPYLDSSHWVMDKSKFTSVAFAVPGTSQHLPCPRPQWFVINTIAVGCWALLGCQSWGGGCRCISSFNPHNSPVRSRLK